MAEEEGEGIGLRKNNFYFSLEVHHGKVHHGEVDGKAGEVMMLPSQYNVYSWLYSQEEEDCYSEHYPALSSSSSNSSPASSSPYSTSSEYHTSRLPDSSFSPIQEGNSFSKRITTLSTDSRENPPRSILSEASSGESSLNSIGGELHYASTDILALPWNHSSSGSSSRKLRAGSEFVYLDFSVPPSDGWMVTKKASHWPVRSAYM